ncbi:hypothetical protein AB0M39_40165 [Streptomyces sp. NPDC051907]|uniref:hypothetical protein n=1 Tax=Streptomyces sp. NPDC051907 TaxID=3155284 RepID=UPI00341B78E6
MSVPNLPTYQAQKFAYRMENLLKQRRRWDEQPELGFLYLHEKGGIHAEALAIPSPLWKGDPKNLLRSLVHVLTSPSDTVPGMIGDTLRNVPPDLVGLYLRTEGWAPPEEQMPEIHRRRQAGASVPRFETLAGRVETRMMTAVDTMGRLYMTTQCRTDGLVRPCAWEGMHATATTPGYEVDGNIPSLLLQLVMGLKARPART